MQPKRFRKRPVEIEAMQFLGWQNAEKIITWAGVGLYVPPGHEHRMRHESEHDRSNGHILDDAPAYLVIPTLEGDHRADVRDWIVKGVAGEVYPVKPSVFEKSYEPAGDDK